jgi:hypothetical protein
MRYSVLVPAALLLVATAAPASADVVAVHLKGQGGFGGLETQELMPGGDDPGLGAAWGVQLGARFTIFEGYIERNAVGEGSVSRAVLGVRGALGFGDTRLVLRSGLAGLRETDGALAGGDETIADRSGLALRAGGAIEYKLARTLLVGFAIDSEYYGVTPGGVDDIDTGFDVFGTLQLTFELGI